MEGKAVPVKLEVFRLDCGEVTFYGVPVNDKIHIHPKLLRLNIVLLI